MSIRHLPDKILYARKCHHFVTHRPEKFLEGRKNTFDCNAKKCFVTHYKVI